MSLEEGRREFAPDISSFVTFEMVSETFQPNSLMLNAYVSNLVCNTSATTEDPEDSLETPEGFQKVVVASQRIAEDSTEVLLSMRFQEGFGNVSEDFT